MTLAERSRAMSPDRTRLHRPARPARDAGGGRPEAARLPGPPLAAKAFLLSLAIPGAINLGPLALTPSRIVLLVALAPCLVRWLSGRAGPVRAADIAVLLYCAWCAVSLTATEGLSAAVQPAGINVVEVAGAYFLARTSIRSYADLHGMVRILVLILMVLLPFAVVEVVTQQNLVAAFFAQVMSGIAVEGDGTRWGLRRAMSVFGHPILFGVVAACLLPFTHFVLGQGRSMVRRWGLDLLIVFTVFLSLSSAPIALAALLVVLIAWDHLMRSFPWRWNLLGLGLVAAYLAVDIASNQTPVQFYITHFTFDGQTGWYRLLIWDYGTASVAAHPLFGIGLGEWARPGWMTSSIDNFWLVHFMRYGVPAGVLMLSVLVLSALAAARSAPADEETRRARTGYLLTLFGFFFVGWTVHFWGAAFVLFLFVVGSGSWIGEATAPAGAPEAGSADTRARPSPRRRPDRSAAYRTRARPPATD